MRILHTLLGIATVTALATSSFADNKVYPGATQRSDGVWLSQIDNPIVQSDYTLNTLEFSSRGNNQWIFNNFDLFGQWTCAANDPLCTPSAARQGVALNAWPTADASLTPGQLLTVDLHGGAIGGLVGQYSMMRENSNEAVNTVQNVSVQLAPETVVVPINVIVSMPSTTIADTQLIRDQLTPLTDPAYQLALWDDVWLPSLQRVTHPGSILSSEGGQWTYNTRPNTNYSAKGTFPFVSNATGAPLLPSNQIQPDAVWAQCGVQFRLASVRVVNETDPRYVWFTKSGQEQPQGGLIGGDAICGGTIDQRANVGDMLIHANNVPPIFGTVSPFGITVIFDEYATNPTCANIGINGGTEDAGTTNGSTVLVGQEDTTSGLTLSHELGHALNLDHPDHFDTTQCLPTSGKQGNVRNLMCGNMIDQPTPHIMGCDVWGTNPGSRYNCDVEAEDVHPTASCATAHDQAVELTRSMLQSFNITVPTVVAGPPRLCYGPGAAVVQLLAGYVNFSDPYTVTATWATSGGIGLVLGGSTTTPIDIGGFTEFVNTQNALGLLGNETFTVTLSDSLGFSSSATEAVTVVNSTSLNNCFTLGTSPAAVWQSSFGMPM